MINDYDGNGSPDQWEYAYRLKALSPDQQGQYGDPDGDGMNNGQECLAGTDPTNYLSKLAMTDCRLMSETNFLINWSSVYSEPRFLDSMLR